jgi:hypothetical protein
MTGKLYAKHGGVFIETGLHTSDVAELMAAINRLETENAKLRNAIAALIPFLMEDYDGGIMTAEYRAAIELAIAANKTAAK